VPYRQWVFTFPIPVRLALSRRPHLVTAALQACLRVLFSWQRRRLRARGVEDPSCGAITFVQRFGSALQLNVHFHVLVPDGGFDDDGVFVADEAPNDDDVRRIMVRAGRRVMSKLHRFFDDDDDRRREIDRLLEALDAASATPQPVLFPRDARRAPLSAFIEGFSLHAATRVMASDRRGLWRLCAYGARGAVASSRHETRSSRRTSEARHDRCRAAREARAPDSADGREPHVIHHRQVMNQCTAWCLRADEPPARHGRPPASVDH
jgi:hypothetical protein